MSLLGAAAETLRDLAWQETIHLVLPPSTAGEDFAFYLARIPGAMAWIGNGPDDDDRELHKISTT